MSVVAFRYKNFMAFRDTGWIELRPIGLLFGRNSSGKSAIFRGLRLLKQSLRTDDSASSRDQDALRLAVEGQLDLGDFRDVLCQRSESAYNEEEIESLKITFSFRVDIPDLAAKLWQRIQQAGVMPEVNVNQLPSAIEINLEFGLDERNKRKVITLVGVHLDCPCALETESRRIVFMSFFLPGGLVELSDPDQAGRYTTMWRDKWYWASDCGVGEVQEGNRSGESIDWATIEVVQRFGFLPHLQHSDVLKTAVTLGETSNDYEIIEFVLREISKEIRLFLQNIQYLGPVRPQPERVYMLNRFELEHWRTKGMEAWLEFITTKSDGSNKSYGMKSDGLTTIQPMEKRSEALLPDATMRDSLNRLEEDALGSFQNLMNEWVNRLQLGLEVQIETFPVKGGFGYTSQVFIVKENGKQDTLMDVGYGASQVLPVIATCLRVQPGSLVLIEQPELHLHPSAQAELGDLFLQVAVSIEQIQKVDKTIGYRLSSSGVNFLLETHSEHLLYRFRRRIAETSLYKRKVERWNKEAKKGEGDPISPNLLLIPTSPCLPEQLNARLVVRSSHTNELKPLIFDEWGRYVQQPEEFQTFFSQDLDELMAIDDARLDAEEGW